MTWSSFWHSVGRDIEHAATGTAHFATHVVDEGFSTIRALGGDASTAVVGVSTAAEGAVKGAASSLSMPLAIGAAGLAAYFLMKQR